MVAPPATHTTSHNSYGFRGSHLAWGFSIFQPATGCSPPSAKKKSRAANKSDDMGPKPWSMLLYFGVYDLQSQFFSIGIPIYKAIMSSSLCTNQRNGMSSYKSLEPCSRRGFNRWKGWKEGGDFTSSPHRMLLAGVQIPNRSFDGPGCLGLGKRESHPWMFVDFVRNVIKSVKFPNSGGGPKFRSQKVIFGTKNWY